MNLILFLIGIGLLAYGLYLFIMSYDLAKHSELSVGTVVSVKLERARRSPLSYHSAIINFRTRKGKRIEFKSQPLIVSGLGNWPIFWEGQIFPVRYHAQNPRRVKIDSFWHLWFPPVGLLCLGIAALVVAIALTK